MGFFERIERLEDWLDKNNGQKIDMSEHDYIDENTREYWDLVYNANPRAFSKDQIDVIEAAFIYNYSIPIDDEGNPTSPRIRTVNLMHHQYSVDLLKTMFEAMKIGVNLKGCSIPPHRWRPVIFPALHYSFQKDINIIESSNNYIYPELIGIIDAKEKNIDLMRIIRKHQYEDTIVGDSAHRLISSGTLSEKACLKNVDYLNKRNCYESYELTNLIHFIMLGGNPEEFINKFCQNQHLYYITYKTKKGQLISNDAEVKAKNDKMGQFVKAFGLKRLEEKKANILKDNSIINKKVENIQEDEEREIEPEIETYGCSLLEEFLKENYVEEDSEEELAAIKAEEERISQLYR